MLQKKYYLAVIAFLGLPFFVQAQAKFVISGTVKDKKSGEILIGASISLAEAIRSSAITNSYGFYSVSTLKGEHVLVTSFTGYVTDTQRISLNKNIVVNIDLTPESSQLQEVVVSTKRNDDNVTKPLMGVQKLSTNEIKNVPVIFGEKDVLKTIQLLPGIKSAGDGNSGFYVRGGGADQNLILLDEATVYNASHLLGFFSTFNSDAVKDITVYKGGMPAEYGGRLSSVVDIKTNDGNDKNYGLSGGLGLISSRLNAEGPIVKDKGSFSVSARRTYADVFLKLSKDTATRNNTLYFYDLNVKANYKINAKNRVYLSVYSGRDNLAFANTFGIDYGNTTATARWNHIFNSQLFSNTSLIYSNYSYQIKITSDNNDLKITSKIRDLNLKEDLQYYAGANSKINFGFNVIYHTILPGSVTATQSSSFNSLSLQNKYSLENAAYVSHEWSPVEKLSFNYGLRVSSFNVLGPGSFYTYDKAGNTLDTTTYASGKVVKTYTNLEPRFSAGYTLTATSSIKASYTRNVQNLHLLSNSTTSNPTDLWIASSNNVKPEIADQVALGFYKNFKNNKYEFSSEIYYKKMQNQIDYKNGAELRANENVESQLLYGIGRAYGLELFIKKKYGRLTGWIGYTLSKTEKKFDQINDGKYFPATQDRTHDISVVAIFQANKKWTFSGTWVYYTGNAATFPGSKYEVNGQIIFYYTQRNGYRMPAYHRLDLAATLQGRKRAHFESSWTFSVYNAYGHENPYSIMFQKDPGDPTKTQAVQYALFKFVPSVTYNFKF